MSLLILVTPIYEVRDRFFPEAETFPVTFEVTECLWADLEFTDQEFQALYETFWGWACHVFDVYRVAWFSAGGRAAVVFTLSESYFFTFPDLDSYHEGVRRIREVFS